MLKQWLRNALRGALRLGHQYYSSMSKRALTEVFQALNRQTEEHGKPRKENLL